jgi:AraC-like DNA-binding protein
LHIEFLDHDHFEYFYHRKRAEGKLFDYIDFCWQTDFDVLLKEQPSGFSDVLFPNIGYTYIINLGTPFTMELQKHRYNVKSDGFLPRHHYITCHHSAGNCLFGIKFKVCPVLFEKTIDFSEYKEHIFPLAYLIDKKVVNKIREASGFAERVKIVFQYYEELVQRYEASLKYISIVTRIIRECQRQKSFDISIEALAKSEQISNRTLQRYFQACTSFSCKPALQTIRIREAVSHLTLQPRKFNFADWGYYDYSHFCKHLRQFVGDKYYSLFRASYVNRLKQPQ